MPKTNAVLLGFVKEPIFFVESYRQSQAPEEADHSYMLGAGWECLSHGSPE